MRTLADHAGPSSGKGIVLQPGSLLGVPAYKAVWDTIKSELKKKRLRPGGRQAPLAGPAGHPVAGVCQLHPQHDVHWLLNSSPVFG